MGRYRPDGLASVKRTFELSPHCPLFELNGADITDVSVSAFSVIEAFDVVEHIGSGLVSCAVVIPFDSLSFKCSEEAFDHRVVVTTSSVTHAAGDAMFLEQVLEVIA